MKAKYLIRLDDACPTMDISKWQTLEDLFDHFGIKPIVAVVPDNRDPKLDVNSFDPLFWSKVRSWQEKGWTIAMHGYQHLMHYTESKLVLPFYKRSEFAGLPYEEQAKKIRESWELFLSKGVEPTMWIAPAHCFDFLTVKAIHEETAIRVISDGIACNTYYENDFYWIPQQLWELEERRSGLWTVCLHPNMMLDLDISRLRDKIEKNFNNRIVSIRDVELSEKKKTLIDHIYSFFFWQRRRAYKWLEIIRSIYRVF
jgi:predicted deacetylase